MADRSTALTSEFGSLLDETTILSISADYDLTNPGDYAAARDVLLVLAQTAEAEEATGFNPSGLGAEDIVDIAESNTGVGNGTSIADESEAKSCGTPTSKSESSHPLSHTSTTSSRTSTRELPGVLHVNTLDQLSHTEKERELSEMFTSLKIVDIRLALQKSQDDASRALDALLNLQWLEESGQRPKGVDGFFVPDEELAGKRRKGKKKRKGPKAAEASKSPVSPTSPTSPASPAEIESMDENTKNIAWLAERLYMPGPDIRNAYYRKNASLTAATKEILDNYIGLGLHPSPDSINPWTKTRVDRFSWVPSEYVGSASAICPSEEYASDIIDLLGEYFEKPAHLRYDISYNVIAADDGEASTSAAAGDWQQPKPRKVFNVQPERRVRHPPGPPRAQDIQNALAAAHTLAATKDPLVHVGGSGLQERKIGPLFRQAAGFYAERAREQANTWRQATSAEANLLVDRQSTAGMVDLHGVTVADGVDIALDRAWRWWDGLGEERSRLARDGLLVVTGIGRHSAGGKSRLSGSVCKALLDDGWKVEVQTGSYLGHG